MSPYLQEIVEKYRKMGMSTEEAEKAGILANSRKMQDAAMDPNKSKSMSKDERSFYLNLPDKITEATGGYQFSGTGDKNKGMRSNYRQTKRI
jgi:hypothetical protein